MALESASYIAGLDVNNPQGSDPKSQGDDHIRMIKAVLKNTFPNLTGAVTLNQQELNNAGDPYPDQAGQSGKVLKTDGNDVRWESETQELPDQLNQAGKALVSDGSNAYWLMLIPVQTGNAGKVLKTNGANAYWASSSTANDILPTQANQSGKVLKTDGNNPYWGDNSTATDILPNQAGKTGKVLKTNGTSVAWEDAFSATADFPNAKNSTSGWQKLPNGMIMQWGMAADLVFTQSATINPVSFPVTFSSGIMFSSAQVMGSNAGAGYATSVNIDTLSNSGMDLVCWRADNSAVHSVKWFVIGF